MLLKKAAFLALPYFTLAQEAAQDVAVEQAEEIAAEAVTEAELQEAKFYLNLFCADDSDEIACASDGEQAAVDCMREYFDEHKYDEERTSVYNFKDFQTCMNDKVAGMIDEENELDPETIYQETFGDIEAANDPLLSQMLLQLNNLAIQYEKIEASLSDEQSVAVRSLHAGGDAIPAPESMFASDEDRDAAADGAKDQEQKLSELGAEMDSLKRFVELKQLVSFMQPKDKRISRFCFYGCWCLPEGAHSFVAGQGRAVDLSDKACQYLWFCYSCAKQEFRGVFQNNYKECDPDKQKYKYKLNMDRRRPGRYDLRTIRCTDNWYKDMNTAQKWKSNCAKAICECDRGLAMRLYTARNSWDKSRHRIWSKKLTDCSYKQQDIENCNEKHPGEGVKPYESQSQAYLDCIAKATCVFEVTARCLKDDNDNIPVDHEQICCGRYEDLGGRMEQRNHGGTHACCNLNSGGGISGKGYFWQGTWYNVITNCCVNGQVRSAGQLECNEPEEEE